MTSQAEPDSLVLLFAHKALGAAGMRGQNLPKPELKGRRWRPLDTYPPRGIMSGDLWRGSHVLGSSADK
jgi:hypothetical protein